jgi:hypothetical protein
MTLVNNIKNCFFLGIDVFCERILEKRQTVSSCKMLVYYNSHYYYVIIRIENMVVQGERWTLKTSTSPSL